jgi:hypothetical protein
VSFIGHVVANAVFMKLDAFNPMFCIAFAVNVTGFVNIQGAEDVLLLVSVISRNPSSIVVLYPHSHCNRQNREISSPWKSTLFQVNGDLRISAIASI